jgi:hypothetical protein
VNTLGGPIVLVPNKFCDEMRNASRDVLNTVRLMEVLVDKEC